MTSQSKKWSLRPYCAFSRISRQIRRAVGILILPFFRGQLLQRNSNKMTCTRHVKNIMASTYTAQRWPQIKNCQNKHVLESPEPTERKGNNHTLGIQITKYVQKPEENVVFSVVDVVVESNWSDFFLRYYIWQQCSTLVYITNEHISSFTSHFTREFTDSNGKPEI